MGIVIFITNDENGASAIFHATPATTTVRDHPSANGATDIGYRQRCANKHQ